jgi:hypothetical protein
MRNETRFRMVEKLDPVRFKRLLAAADREAVQRYGIYQQLAGLTVPRVEPPPAAPIEAPAEETEPAGAKE